MFGDASDPWRHAVIAVSGDSTHYAGCAAHTLDVQNTTIQQFFTANPTWTQCTYYNLADASVPCSTKFTAGEWATATGDVNMRTGPGFGYPKVALPAGHVPLGSTVQICASPDNGKANNGYYWWYVGFDTAATTYYGWCAQDWLGETIEDQQKQNDILGMANEHRGSLPPELVLGVMRQEGGEGAFHVDGWAYNSFYIQDDGAWAQPTNGDGVMQVTAASGHHEVSGPYTHDEIGYDHAINDGCDYLLENFSGYGSLVQAALHYNTGPNSLYIYLGRNWGDRSYLSDLAGHLDEFVPGYYGLVNPPLVTILRQGQTVLDDYLYGKGILAGQAVNYYAPYQGQLDGDLYAIEAGDTIQPTVDNFSVTPASVVAGESVTISYKVSDTGGSGLNRVELWRTDDTDASGNPIWHSDDEVKRTPISGNGPVSDVFTDSPSSVGSYWYGIHVVDNAGKWNDEQNSRTGNQPGDFGPIQVMVVSQLPQVVIDDPSVTEGDAGTRNLRFTVSLSGTPGQFVSVHYETSDGTATANSDYTPESGNLVCAPGETDAAWLIYVPILGDYEIEGDETLTVHLSEPNGVVISDGVGVGTILNDDYAGTFQFASTAYYVHETAGSAIITVTRTGGLGANAGVHYATSNGTAVEASDYTVASGLLTFSGGEGAKDITVPIINDTEMESNETVNLTLSAPTGGATLGAPTTALLTIWDDDRLHPPQARVLWGEEYISNGGGYSAGVGTDWGLVMAGQPGPSHTFTVRNIGAYDDLCLGPVEVPQGFLVTEELSSVIAAGDSDTFTVQLLTTAAGTFSGDIAFDTNGPQKRWHFGVIGTVEPPETPVPVILQATDPEGCSAFGKSADLSGDFAIVGASQASLEGLTTAGAAYIYHWDGGGWVQVARLAAGDPLLGAGFGESVAIDGDYAVVGAKFAANAAGLRTGAAYVFHRSGTTWSQVAKLTAQDVQAYGFLGWAVALDGTRALVGMNSAAGSSGAAYVFECVNSTWTQTAKLLPSDSQPDDRFGFAVTLDGNQAAVANTGGNVYVFQKDGSAWVQTKELSLPSFYPRTWPLGLSGDFLAVGAPKDGTLGNGAGAVYVFQHTGSDWVQSAKLTAADGDSDDNLGWSVGISGDLLVAGAYEDENRSPTHLGGRGSAYAFRRIGATWVEQAKLVGVGTLGDDHLGSAAAVDANRAIIGAVDGDLSDAPNYNLGLACLFDLSGVGVGPDINVLVDGSEILDGQATPISIGTAQEGMPGPTKTFTVRNDGDAPLVLTAPFSDLPHFAVGQPGKTTLNHGETTTFTVTLKTQAAWSGSEVITLGSNDGDENAFSFPVQGTVAAPVPPKVIDVTFNPLGRSISAVEPGAVGVHLISVRFSEPVSFGDGDVLLQKVTFNGNVETVYGTLTPALLAGAGTDTMTIAFSSGSVVDTWVKVTLKGEGLLKNMAGRLLDGEPASGGSGQGYIYSAALDLPSGNGAAGGDAVFYVGSLRGDSNGDLAITAADKDGFAVAWRSGSLDADFRGVGFGPRPPDGRITLADINGFTSVYQAGIALGRHLDSLPMSSGGLASEVTPLPPLTAPSAGTDILTEAAGLLPLSRQTAPPVTGPQDTHRVQGDEEPLDLLRLRRLRPVAVIQSARAVVLRL